MKYQGRPMRRQNKKPKNIVPKTSFHIPSSDFKRTDIFGDPLVNVLKSIFIKNQDDILVEYDHNKEIYIDIAKERNLFLWKPSFGIPNVFLKSFSFIIFFYYKNFFIIRI